MVAEAGNGEAAATNHVATVKKLLVKDARQPEPVAEETVKSTVEAAAFFRKSGDTGGEAAAVVALADLYLRAGDATEALQEARHAGLLLRRLGWKRGEANLLLDTVVPALQSLRKTPEALKAAEEAATLARDAGDRPLEAASLRTSARTWLAAGKTDEALQAARQATKVLIDAKENRAEAEAHHAVAHVHLARHESREAITASAQALTLLRKRGDEPARATVLETAALAHAAGREPNEALSAAWEAATLYKQLRDRPRASAALHSVAQARISLRDFEGAADAAREALALGRDVPDRRREAQLLHTLATALLGRIQAHLNEQKAGSKEVLPTNWADEALQASRQATQMFRELGDQYGEAAATWTAGHARLERGEPDLALDTAKADVALFQALEDRLGEAWAFVLQAAILLRGAPAPTLSPATGLTVTLPATADAREAALAAHAAFRAAGDADGELAALSVLEQVRSVEAGPAAAPPRDAPRQRPTAFGAAFGGRGLLGSKPANATLLGPRLAPWGHGGQTSAGPQVQAFPSAADSYQKAIEGPEEKARQRLSKWRLHAAGLLDRGSHPEVPAAPENL